MDNVFEIIEGSEWYFGWERRMTYQKMRLFSYPYQNEIPKMFGVSMGSELYRVRNLRVSECYGLREYVSGFSRIEAQFVGAGSVDMLRTLIGLIENFEKKFSPYVEGMLSSYDSLTDVDLLKSYMEYCEAERQISLPGWILFGPFEDIITRTLRRALEAELGDPKRTEKILSELSLPDKMLPLDFHNRALCEIALAPHGERERLLDAFSEQFIHWGMYDVINDEATREPFAKKLAELEKTDVEKMIREIDGKYATQRERATAVLASWEGNEYIFGLLDLYRHYANYKDWKNYYRERSNYKLKILLKEIARRIGLSLEECAFLTEEETAQALRKNVSFDPAEIRKRIVDSAFLFVGGELAIITDLKLLSLIDRAITFPQGTELKGTGAYPGKVRGIVRIIIGNNDFWKLQAGDIFVTSTTRPDFVPIMAKASGFVTNEGGLLSHAAIVARELKKPCIIGTKIATQVLKDGDLVEVDAEKGVVRILK